MACNKCGTTRYTCGCGTNSFGTYFPSNKYFYNKKETDALIKGAAGGVTLDNIKNMINKVIYKVEFGAGMPYTNSAQALASIPKEKGNIAIVIDKDGQEITTNYYDGATWLQHHNNGGTNHFDFTYYDTTASQNSDAPNKNENDLSYNKETGDLYFLDSTKTWVHMNLNNKSHDVGFRLADISGDGNDDVYNVDGHRLMLTDASSNILSLEHQGQAVPKQYVDMTAKDILDRLNEFFQTQKVDIPGLTAKTVGGAITELLALGTAQATQIATALKHLTNTRHYAEFDSSASDPTAITTEQDALATIQNPADNDNALIYDKVAGKGALFSWHNNAWVPVNRDVAGVVDLSTYLKVADANSKFATKTELGNAFAGIPTDDMSWETKKENKLHNYTEESGNTSHIGLTNTFTPNETVIQFTPTKSTNLEMVKFEVENANEHPQVTASVSKQAQDGSPVAWTPFMATNDNDIITKGYLDAKLTQDPTFETRTLKDGDDSTDASTLKSGDLLSSSNDYYLYDGHAIYWVGSGTFVFDNISFTNYQVKVIEDTHDDERQNKFTINVDSPGNEYSIELDVNCSVHIDKAVNIIKRVGNEIELIGIKKDKGTFKGLNETFTFDQYFPDDKISSLIGKQYKVNSNTFPSNLMNRSENYIIQIVAKVSANSKNYEVNLGSFELASIKEMQNGLIEPETIKRSIDGADSMFTINHTGITSTPAIAEMRITVLTKVHS